MLCVADQEVCTYLSRKAKCRLSSAFRPKTSQCYSRMFRAFIAFCVRVIISLCVKFFVFVVLSFLEYLVVHRTSVSMIVNYVSALRAMCVIYNLPYVVFDQPQVKYYVKALKITRPLAVPVRNVMDIKTLRRLVQLATVSKDGITLKVMFLVDFFGSNLVPHNIRDFDPSR